jgi:hypothetical protein
LPNRNGLSSLTAAASRDRDVHFTNATRTHNTSILDENTILERRRHPAQSAYNCCCSGGHQWRRGGQPSVHGRSAKESRVILDDVLAPLRRTHHYSGRMLVNTSSVIAKPLSSSSLNIFQPAACPICCNLLFGIRAAGRGLPHSPRDSTARLFAARHRSRT